MRMTKDVITVSLIDSHKLFREGIKSILNLESSFKVIAEADDGRQANDIVVQYQPDVLLMDMDMEDMNGIEATKEILENNPTIKIGILSVENSEEAVVEAIQAGVKGYLLKEMDTDSLKKAISIISDGGAYLHPKVTKYIVNHYQKITNETMSNNELFNIEYRKPLHILTRRECQVLQLLSEGESNRQISKSLVISEKTVKNHVSNILQKMDVEDRTKAVIMAIRNGWVEIFK